MDLTSHLESTIVNSLRGPDLEFTKDIRIILDELPTNELSKPMVEVAFKKCLNALLLPNNRDDLLRLLDLSIIIVANDLADAGLTFLLLEDLAESIPVWELSLIIEFLESRGSSLVTNISSSKGKGLVLLRLCNEIIRRLSKSQEPSFCGRVLLFISKVFPSGERSGVNLRGDINVENTTPIDSNGSMSNDAQHEFYSSFWKLQFYMYHPVQALISENWPIVQRGLEDTLNVFEKTKSLSGSKEFLGEFYPKYLSDNRLFNLQIVDSKWREIILTQMAMFLQHLLGYSSKEEHKPPSAKGLNENWIHDFQRKLFSYISSTSNGRPLSKLIKSVLRGEKNWMAWKALSCPPFELAAEAPFVLESFKKSQLDVSEISNDYNVGSVELSRLWRFTPADSSTNLKRNLKPKVATFFEPLIEQMDPEAGIEEEYRISHDEIFRWKALRLFLTKDSSPDFFNKSAFPSGIEQVCQKLLHHHHNQQQQQQSSAKLEEHHHHHHQ